MTTVRPTVGQPASDFSASAADGRTSVGITRTTFIIDPDGMIRHVVTRVKVEQHGDDVMQVIRDLAE